MKVVVLGATGQLGQAFINAPDFAYFNALCLTRAELDICDADAVSACFANIQPDVVINCAAYTEQDAPNPINHYGMSKWLAEQQVKQHSEKYLILRTSCAHGLKTPMLRIVIPNRSNL